MMDLQRAKKVRDGHRVHADKLINKAVKDPPKGTNMCDETEVLLATLKKKVDVIEKCDAEILDLTTEENDVAAEIENSSAYSDKITEAVTKLELTLKHFDKKKAADSKPVVKTEPESSSNMQIKLPAIKVGEYDGSLLTWSVFWDKFDVAIHSRSDLADIQKYTYLKSYLVGEAKRAIQGVTYDKDNYQNAIDTLKSRFGNKQLRVSAHMKELQNITAVLNIHDVSGLRRMYDCLETNIGNLKVLGVDVATYGSLLIAVIYNRIPDELRIKISLHFADQDWKLDDAMKIFKNELEARERSSAIAGASTNSDWYNESGSDFATGHSLQINASPRLNSPRSRGRGRGTHRGGRGRRSGFNNENFSNIRPNGGANQRTAICAFCKEGHLSSRCSNITDIAARLEIVQRERRCFICLKQNHRSRDCNLQFYSCVRCNQKHNIALCDFIGTLGQGVTHVAHAVVPTVQPHPEAPSTIHECC